MTHYLEVIATKCVHVHVAKEMLYIRQTTFVLSETGELLRLVFINMCTDVKKDVKADCVFFKGILYYFVKVFYSKWLRSVLLCLLFRSRCSLGCRKLIS